MFCIILLDQDNRAIETVSSPGNEDYLPQEDDISFPYLSELSTSSYDVFDSEDMAKLVCEIQALQFKVEDETAKEHLKQITKLAERCKQMTGYKLSFNPFII